MKIIIWLTSLILLINLSGTAQVGKTKNRQRSKLEAVNRQFADAVLSEDINKLMRFYASDAVSMPEYQPMLKGNDAIRKYSQEIFNRQKIKSFDKKISEVIDLEKYVAEIGSFTKEFTVSSGEPPLKHNGKYLNIWKVQPDGTWQLKAESFGYFENIKNPAALFVKITEKPTENNSTQSPNDNKNISLELHALNALMEEAVRNRDGNLRADFFSQDAVFMPFADSPKTGIKEIREHLIAYNSGNVIIDSINIYSDYAEVAGAYVIEYPKFDVKWHTPEVAGTGQGKGIRIWRREPDCSLRLYREIGLHDYLE